MKRRPSLRTILLLINLAVMLLPLGGIAWLRLYESALVRQTESELLAQGAVVAAAFGAALDNLPGEPMPTLPRAVVSAEPWQPRPPRLDLASDRIEPRPPDAQPTALAPDARAAAIGAQFSAILREVRRTTLAGIRVLDHQGIIVASTSGEVGLQLQQHEVARALEGETVTLLRERKALDKSALSRSEDIRVFVALPVIEDGLIVGAVLLARTPASLWNAIQGKRMPLLYAAIGLVLVVLALSWVTTRTLARPIAELREQAQRAMKGERGALRPLRHAGTREVADLSETLMAMSATLESRADYIRRFAAQVSHEFKTPLTSIRGAVELLREHAGELDAAERTRFEDMIAADAARLDRLVRRLLELARADTAAPGDECSDALAVLRSCIERARHLHGVVEADLPAVDAITRAPVDVLESIFGNLLDNAREHAPGAPVRVTAAVQAAQLQVRITDQGPGISAGNAGRIFEPFFTTARNRGSTGLGLSIVQALVEAHGGDIRAVPCAAGASFELHLPLVSMV